MDLDKCITLVLVSCVIMSHDKMQDQLNYNAETKDIICNYKIIINITNIWETARSFWTWAT